MPSVSVEMAILIIGIVAGYFGAYYRPRRDLAILERQIESHFKLAQEQYKLQIATVDRGQRRIKVQEAYDQLGRWLHGLERTIDEVWFGCATQDKNAEQRAKHIVDQWPWETLKVPAEFYPAGFYWSSGIRESIRKFEGASVEFTTEAAVALNLKNNPEKQGDLGTRKSKVWKPRSRLLSIIDEIRGTAKADLAPEEG